MSRHIEDASPDRLWHIAELTIQYSLSRKTISTKLKAYQHIILKTLFSL